jgi:hypothetical protein
MTSRVLLVMVVIAAAVWSMNRWRLGVQVAMVLLVFEGAIRKWLLPGSQDLVYFAKDVILLGCYAGFFGLHTRLARLARVPAPLVGLLLAGAVYGGMAIANPGVPNALTGLFGFKAYFLYIPLIFLVPAMFDSETELTRFLYRYALLAIPVGLLAVVQFRSPASSLINTYAWDPGDASQVITFGITEQVRVTGTFSFITGYSAYALFTALIIMALLAARRWRIRGNIPLFAALLLTLVGMLMTGSRAPVLRLLIVLPVYLWFTVVRARGGAAAIGRILFVVALGVALLSQAFFPAAEAFLARAGGGGEDAPSRIMGALVDPYYAFEVGGFLGEGIGTTHQAVHRLAPPGAPGVSGPLAGSEAAFESESGRVVVELGLVGFLLIYAPRIVLVVLALQCVSALKRPSLRGLGTVSLLILVLSLTGAVVFNVTEGLFYWFFTGLLFAVVRLDRLAERQQVQPSPAAVVRRPAAGQVPAWGRRNWAPPVGRR